jgi:hypothetical protein
MPRTLNRLKPLAVERRRTPGGHADGGGLYVVVKPGSAEVSGLQAQLHSTQSARPAAK